jgi:maltooligosyltrehalose trehalohydrolase
MKAGTKYLGNDRCSFTVWAPGKEKMILHIVHPSEQKVEMQKDDMGYFTAEVQTPVGTKYLYIIDDAEKGLPDPASQYQPDGVHGASQVIDHNTYQWNDRNYKAPAFEDLILYELHIGTFTEQGTFESAIEKLDQLTEVGINAIEIMPVAQFPGDRNWGYDGVYPYAVQNSYGGPEGLKKLVDACHQKGIAVFLDVVYNHQGPEGNYIEQFAPYFTEHYKTPWGKAINYDGEWSDGVREFYSDNAIYWLQHFHIDGLRFDAVHAIYDFGAVHFWEIVHAKVRELEKKSGRCYHTIAESDLNAPRVIHPVEKNGFGFTAQWLDDFHHAAYVLLDKAGKDRYYDFGTMHQLAKSYCEGYVHSGEFVKFRKRKYGKSSAGIPGNKFVAFINNHDQSGNRIDGARLCTLIDLDLSKIATAMLLLSPYVPMLFMGEEYADDSPFYYFISHSDPSLIKAVQEGRKEEFKAMIKPGMEYPDPQSGEIFKQSKLKWEKRNQGKNKIILNWHTELIRLRKSHPALKNFNKECIRAEVLQQDGLILHRKDETGKKEVVALMNISDAEIDYFLPGTNGTWKKLLDSTEAKWNEENTSTNKAEFSTTAQAGEQIKIPAKAVILLGKEID